MNYLEGTQKAIAAYLKERDASIRFVSRLPNPPRPTTAQTPRTGAPFQAHHLHGSILPNRA